MGLLERTRAGQSFPHCAACFLDLHVRILCGIRLRRHQVELGRDNERLVPDNLKLIRRGFLIAQYFFRLFAAGKCNHETDKHHAAPFPRSRT